VVDLEYIELPPGRVLPDDVRCMKCNSWLRGGPQAWGKALDQEAEAAASPRTLWLSLASLAVGVAGVIALAALYPSEDNQSRAPAVIAALITLAAALALAWLAVRPMIRERGGLIAGIGAAVGFVLAPLVFAIFAFVFA
jgi:ferric-dicitrate binding protein FerR (iron transport regulator)